MRQKLPGPNAGWVTVGEPGIPPRHLHRVDGTPIDLGAFIRRLGLEARTAYQAPIERHRPAKANVCRKGHPLTEDNIKLNKDGKRQCRTCVNDRVRERTAEQRQEVGYRNEYKFCQRGLHRMAGANVIVKGDGRRRCAACKREVDAQYRAAHPKAA